MKTLCGSKQIKDSIIKACPTKIAVAYIGKDFQKYINPEAIESIIISPTLGSNPVAIGKLREIIGWDKILFMDNLHAKLYIGENYAIVGSANLTNNALGVNGLVEVCVEISRNRENSAFSELTQIFKRLRDQVKDKTPEEKRNMLQKLHIKWRSLIQIVDDNGKTEEAQLFDKYTIEKNGIFYLVWYEGSREKTNEAEYENLYGKGWESYIFDEIDIAGDDIKIITPNNWVLTWKKRKTDDYTYKNPNPSWLYVHRIIKNASADENYPHALVNESNTMKPPVPFEIDEKFKEAFREVINRDKFTSYRTQSTPIWHTKNTINLFEPFINEVKKVYMAT